MKAFIVLAVVCAVARAGVVHAPLGVYGVAETGASQVSRVENGLGSYSFGYDEAHTSGGSFHKESGSPGVKVGSYGLTGADGRVRVVNYVADGLGFRADIKTNEPGVGAQDPAATIVNKAGVVAAAPVVAGYAAPVAAVHAPVAAVHAPIAAPHVLGAAYSTHVAHHGGIVAPAVKYAAHVAAPVAAAIHGGIGYTHAGIVAPYAHHYGAHIAAPYVHGVHGLGYGIHGLGYGINGIHGYAAGIHAGLPGHVTKIGHAAHVKYF